MSFIAFKESVTVSSPWYAITFRVESIVNEELTEIGRCVLESDMKWRSLSVEQQFNQLVGRFCVDIFSFNSFKEVTLFFSVSSLCEMRLKYITKVNWTDS